MLRLFWVSALLAGSLANAAIPHQYERELRAAAERWLPGVDYRLWAAQVYQESRFDCSARSRVGAMGCAQLMPGTWGEIADRFAWESVSPYAASYNIEAGAYYLSRQRAIFRAPRPESCRHDLAVGAYNAGAGNIIRAQRLAPDGGICWASVAAALPQVTGSYSRETIDYVRLIRERWYPILLQEWSP